MRKILGTYQNRTRTYTINRSRGLPATVSAWLSQGLLTQLIRWPQWKRVTLHRPKQTKERACMNAQGKPRRRLGNFRCHTCHWTHKRFSLLKRFGTHFQPSLSISFELWLPFGSIPECFPLLRLALIERVFYILLLLAHFISKAFLPSHFLLLRWNGAWLILFPST